MLGRVGSGRLIVTVWMSLGLAARCGRAALAGVIAFARRLLVRTVLIHGRSPTRRLLSHHAFDPLLRDLYSATGECSDDRLWVGRLPIAPPLVDDPRDLIARRSGGGCRSAQSTIALAARTFGRAGCPRRGRGGPFP